MIFNSIGSSYDASSLKPSDCFSKVDTETSLFNVGEDFQALVSIVVDSSYFFVQNTLCTCDLEKCAQTMNDHYSTADPPSIL
ncbi:unnamed protein product [Rotaria socialis]|uniref:Uncharacterized protein n=1 Tax=Rotaria socialis TaxID=392032 RepID=A0A818III3_9BILA|nr:unnamed protein product [Rotaria socialis]CAF4138331.1 unnamed protein product [Rotaria socialis]